MKIHQLLFGYDNGHGLLAGSKTIESAKDIARLSMLTDWTGYHGTSDNDSSYISAFPLVDSNQYAITKSWYANEMSRPGCVWTHVLLIDIENIDSSFDFKNLIDLFKRPTLDKYEEFSVALEYKSEAGSSFSFQVSSFTDETSILFIIDSLLSTQKPFGVKIERNATDNQLFLLSLMQYLPIDVLKKISFSSGSEKFRMLDKETMFTMQFVQNGNTVSLQTPPWMGKVKDDMFSSGIRFLANSYCSNNNEVVKLLRAFRFDIQDNYAKIESFCTLLDFLYQAINNVYKYSYLNILNILAQGFPTASEGVSLKANYLSHKVSSLFCSEKEYLYDISTYDSNGAFQIDDKNIKDRLTDLLTENVNDYLCLLVDLAESEVVNEYGQLILLNCFEALTSQYINEIAQNNWHAFVSLLSVNESYLNKAEWLNFDSLRFRDVLRCFASTNIKNFQYWDNLLYRILMDSTPLTPNFVTQLVEHCTDYNSKILDFLNSQKELSSSVDANIIRGMSINETQLLKWLSLQSSCSNTIVGILLKMIVPNGLEIKKFRSSILIPLSNYDDGNRMVDYYLFLFKASYNWHDNNALKFLKQSFYHLHRELARGNDHLWSELENYSASVFFLQDWDKCKKLRKGVSLYMKSSGYPKSVVGDFTPDNDINGQMLSYW